MCVYIYLYIYIIGRVVDIKSSRTQRGENIIYYYTFYGARSRLVLVFLYYISYICVGILFDSVFVLLIVFVAYVVVYTGYIPGTYRAQYYNNVMKCIYSSSRRQCARTYIYIIFSGVRRTHGSRCPCSTDYRAGKYENNNDYRRRIIIYGRQCSNPLCIRRTPSSRPIRIVYTEQW